MNEFTKEELEEIKIAMGWHYMQQVALEENKNRIKNIDALGVKIQSMINNYNKTCKHPSTNLDNRIYYCND